MAYTIFIILAASFLLELYTGKLKYKFHPLNIMGFIAVSLEKFFNSKSKFIPAFTSGVLFNLIAVFTLSLLFSFILSSAFVFYPPLFYILSVYIFASFMSVGGLRYESLKIYNLIKSSDINGARKNLISLAGRDAHNLDESEISRAVIESVAENTGDGIGSLIFYFFAGAAIMKLLSMHFFYKLKLYLPSLPLFTVGGYYNIHIFAAVFCGIIFSVIYKSVNLLDALVGYRNDKYEKFGKFSARLDDALNYIPFRITAFFMALSVFILSVILKANRFDFIETIKSFLSFRKNHPSPNGGQLESIAAGAFKIRLGGLNFYGGVKSERPPIGFGNYSAPSYKNIPDMVKIMELTSVLLVFFYFSVIFIIVAALPVLPALH